MENKVKKKPCEDKNFVSENITFILGFLFCPIFSILSSIYMNLSILVKFYMPYCTSYKIQVTYKQVSYKTLKLEKK